ncbi:hypothetical protein L6R52_07190 [Myxococcota bacterium]|nr:hypothetical protein [Myxococcota bacterium]
MPTNSFPILTGGKEKYTLKTIAMSNGDIWIDEATGQAIEVEGIEALGQQLEEFCLEQKEPLTEELFQRAPADAYVRRYVSVVRSLVIGDGIVELEFEAVGYGDAYRRLWSTEGPLRVFPGTHPVLPIARALLKEDALKYAGTLDPQRSVADRRALVRRFLRDEARKPASAARARWGGVPGEREIAAAVDSVVK